MSDQRPFGMPKEGATFGMVQAMAAAIKENKPPVTVFIGVVQSRCRCGATVITSAYSDTPPRCRLHR